MRTLLLWAGLLTAGAAHAQGPAIMFKSVPFGASQAEYLAAFPDHLCSSAKFCTYDRLRDCVKKTGGPIDGAVCNSRNTWAGLDMVKAMASFENGKLEMVVVTIRPGDYERVAASARERWGLPDNESEEAVQTRIGARYLNKTARWAREGGVLILRKYGKTIDEGSAILLDKAAADRRVDQFKAAPAEGAKDM